MRSSGDVACAWCRAPASQTLSVSGRAMIEALIAGERDAAVLANLARVGLRAKNTYVAARLCRLAGRRGKKRAAVAVGHSILVIADHLLDRHEPYAELGGDSFETRLSEQAHIRRLVAQLERLGQKVTLEPLETPAA